MMNGCDFLTGVCSVCEKRQGCVRLPDAEGRNVGNSKGSDSMERYPTERDTDGG